jgi:hypothetical protein
MLCTYFSKGTFIYASGLDISPKTPKDSSASDLYFQQIDQTEDAFENMRGKSSEHADLHKNILKTMIETSNRFLVRPLEILKSNSLYKIYDIKNPKAIFVNIDNEEDFREIYRKHYEQIPVTYQLYETKRKLLTVPFYEIYDQMEDFYEYLRKDNKKGLLKFLGRDRDTEFQDILITSIGESFYYNVNFQPFAPVGSTTINCTSSQQALKEFYEMSPSFLNNDLLVFLSDISGVENPSMDDWHIVRERSVKNRSILLYCDLLSSTFNVSLNCDINADNTITVHLRNPKGENFLSTPNIDNFAVTMEMNKKAASTISNLLNTSYRLIEIVRHRKEVAIRTLIKEAMAKNNVQALVHFPYYRNFLNGEIEYITPYHGVGRIRIIIFDTEQVMNRLNRSMKNVDSYLEEAKKLLSYVQKNSIEYAQTLNNLIKKHSNMMDEFEANVSVCMQMFAIFISKNVQCIFEHKEQVAELIERPIDTLERFEKAISINHTDEDDYDSIDLRAEVIGESYSYFQELKQRLEWIMLEEIISPGKKSLENKIKDISHLNTTFYQEKIASKFIDHSARIFNTTNITNLETNEPEYSEEVAEGIKKGTKELFINHK